MLAPAPKCKKPLPCKEHSLYGEWSAILHRSYMVHNFGI
uniref:Uncharacterized protein n=1 Tax=Setaria italica TaxID=4555 RepID=K3XUB1_SETIT